jgi:hypothetical protein
MDILICPNCSSQVARMSTGECPSCRKFIPAETPPVSPPADTSRWLEERSPEDHHRSGFEGGTDKGAYAPAAMLFVAANPKGADRPLMAQSQYHESG